MRLLLSSGQTIQRGLCCYLIIVQMYPILAVIFNRMRRMLDLAGCLSETANLLNGN